LEEAQHKHEARSVSDEAEKRDGRDRIEE